MTCDVACTFWSSKEDSYDILTRFSQKKSHTPKPYTRTMIFSDVVLEHMLSETNTDRTVAMQTSHLQVIRIITGKHNASLTSEHFGWTVEQKTTKINRVEHPNVPIETNEGNVEQKD